VEPVLQGAPEAAGTLEAISQAKLCSKHWHLQEKYKVLVVDDMAVGRARGCFGVELRNKHSHRLNAAALVNLIFH
jgi:hypothetical protein